MPCSLQADTANEVGRISQTEPGVVGQSDDALLDQLYIALDLLLVATDAELEGIFQHNGQQFG